VLDTALKFLTTSIVLRLIPPFLVMAIAVGVASSLMPRAQLLGWLYLLCGFVSYLLLLHHVGEEMLPAKQLNTIGLFCLFFLTSVLLVLLFSFAWCWFFPFGSPAGDRQDGHTAIYFSAVVMTTLGFGDLVPLTTSGKYLVIVEALFGSAHMVAFFSIGMARVLTPP
jgi:hypothetical protein